MISIIWVFKFEIIVRSKILYLVKFVLSFPF